MSNDTSSILAAVYLDQIIEKGINLGSLLDNPGALEGSLFNPLQALQHMSLDPLSEMNYQSDEMAAAAGVPVNWFDDELLDAPLDEVLTALGKVALIYLSSQGNWVLENAPIENVREDSLKAVEIMDEVLAINRKRKAQGLH